MRTRPQFLHLASRTKNESVWQPLFVEELEKIGTLKIVENA
jgi:hypothetical protein